MSCPPGTTAPTRLTIRCWHSRAKIGFVLITEDKDFGELVFVRRMVHPGIVRLVEMPPMERTQAMQSLIEHHAEAMRNGAIVVVTRTRVRIRLLQWVEPDNE